MNVQAIEPTSARNPASQAGATKQPARQAPPPAAAHAAPAVSVAAMTTPAATATVTSVPASVKPEDRALYLQILKSLGGNVNAALAALQAKEASAG
jgi:hypothetical protein